MFSHPVICVTFMKAALLVSLRELVKSEKIRAGNSDIKGCLITNKLDEEQKHMFRECHTSFIITSSQAR